ncbi:MAG: TonB-dependent receptor [Gemmatimonadota bacterium]|nr:TonB-dependent receptor [Gemmatimonadota bacterium]
MSNRYCPGGMAAVLALALGAFGAGGLAAQTGTLTGEVMDATSGQPLNEAHVTIDGTRLFQITNSAGRYVIQNVPVGVYTVRAQIVGHATGEQQITVTPGSTQIANFRLSVSAVAVDELVAVGIAGVERKKIGVSLPTVDVGQIQEMIPVGGFTQVLEGRVPGVKSIGNSGGVGSGRELRIRGTDSFGYTAQRPVIYIDGVRYDAQKEEWAIMRGVACCFFSGGAGEDRLSDLNPEEIDRIEVLKGPAAATLFGAEASAGVIQVFTKRGRSDTPATFTLNTGLGRNRLRANLPTTLRPNVGSRDIATGEQVFSALDPNEHLIENGLINNYDLTVHGGSSNITYFVSTGVTYEEGSIQPNDQIRGSFRVNLNWTADELQVGLTSGFVRNKILVVQAGDSWLSPYGNAMMSDPSRADEKVPYGGGREGYTSVEASKEVETFSDTDRWTGRLQFSYTPLPTFTHQLTFGLDAVTDQKTRHMPYGNYYRPLDNAFGERNLGYRRSRKFTTDYLSTLDYDNLFGLGFLTGSISVGAQGYWDVASMTMGTGKRFGAPGIKSIGGASWVFSDEDFEERVNVGFFVQNRFDITDDLFLTAAVRSDGNSAFGENYGLQMYPKADVAYNLPQRWLPPGVSNLKFRAAVGMAGKAPGPFDHLQSYTPTTVFGTQPGVRVASGGSGNQELGPENKREIETGLDIGMFSNRIGFELTYYDALVLNGLFVSQVPASIGVVERVENCCKYVNRGIEAAMSASLVDMPAFRWSMNIAYEWNRNRIISFGPQAQDDSMPLYRQKDDGYWEHIGWRYNRSFGPVENRWWEQSSLDRVKGRALRGYDPRTRRHLWTHHEFFRGLAQPRHMGSLFNSFQLGSDLRVSVQFRGEVGAIMQNWERWYGVHVSKGFDEYLEHLDENGDPTRASDSVVDYHLLRHTDKRDHIRLQDVSIVYTVPQGLADMLGLARTTVTLSGYNLHWWDDCNCIDPNTKFSANDTGGNSTVALFAIPQPRRFLLSLRTRF